MQTIRDVAKKAHVSTATVSRVLNNTKAVSPELRQRVAEAVLSIGYRPNAVARSLVTKKSRTIGIIIPDISNPIFGALTKGINAVCQRSGYALMVCESGGECQREFELLDVLSSKNIDGLLFACEDISEDQVDRIKKENYPVVLVTQEAPGKKELLPTVAHDNIQAVYDAVSFLIDNGHRNIALIAGKKCDYSSGQKRIIGYKKALIDHGIQLVDSYIEYGDFTFDSGYRCMKKIYEENDILPSAIMVCSDLMAMGAIRYLSTTNTLVPNDISVMGFDDLDMSQFFTPTLTSVRISYYDEGKQAAEELFQVMQEEHPTESKTFYIPHKIIRRNSVKCFEKR